MYLFISLIKLCDIIVQLENFNPHFLLYFILDFAALDHFRMQDSDPLNCLSHEINYFFILII